jgi:hypothetical protein
MSHNREVVPDGNLNIAQVAPVVRPAHRAVGCWVTDLVILASDGSHWQGRAYATSLWKTRRSVALGGE